MAIYPFAYVGENAVIGDGTTLHPGAVIGVGCTLGKECIVHPNAVLYPNVILGDRVEVHAGTVLGGDGFGYRQVEGRHVKVPHSGRLEVGNDVEIGSNCTIDRATFEATRIGEGTKIDNLVMIGHNNQIGRHNLLCGQVGIAGSCKTGDYVVMAGQAGIKDNTRIGDGVVVGAQAGVHRNVPDGQQILGSPAIPVREQRRIFQMIARLPEMHRQLRELQRAGCDADRHRRRLSPRTSRSRVSSRVDPPEHVAIDARMIRLGDSTMERPIGGMTDPAGSARRCRFHSRVIQGASRRERDCRQATIRPRGTDSGPGRSA